MKMNNKQLAIMCFVVCLAFTAGYKFGYNAGGFDSKNFKNSNYKKSSLSKYESKRKSFIFEESQKIDIDDFMPTMQMISNLAKQNNFIWDDYILWKNYNQEKVLSDYVYEIYFSDENKSNERY